MGKTGQAVDRETLNHGLAHFAMCYRGEVGQGSWFFPDTS